MNETPQAAAAAADDAEWAGGAISLEGDDREAPAPDPQPEPAAAAEPPAADPPAAEAAAEPAAPTGDEDDAALEAAAIPDAQGNKYVSLQTLIQTRTKLKERADTYKAKAEAGEVLADAIRQHPDGQTILSHIRSGQPLTKREQAIVSRAAESVETPAPAPQPTARTYQPQELQQIAEDLGLVDDQGQWDLAKAERIQRRTDDAAERAARAAVAPIHQRDTMTAAEQKALEYLPMAEQQGIPRDMAEMILGTLARENPQMMLEQPHYAWTALTFAKGLMKDAAPPAGDPPPAAPATPTVVKRPEPVMLEQPTARRSGPSVLSSNDKARLSRLGVDKARFGSVEKALGKLATAADEGRRSIVLEED